MAAEPASDDNSPQNKTASALEDNITADNKPSFSKQVAQVDVEAIGDRTSSIVDDELYPSPTEQEYLTLRKVADSIPHTAYLLCIVELAERASYYGASTVFSNFMQFPLPDGGNGAGAPARGTEDTAGALGKGLQFSNAMTLLFKFLAYIIPIFGGMLFTANNAPGHANVLQVGWQIPR